MKRRKIDYFFEGRYIGSTSHYKTCRDAKEMYLMLARNSQYRERYEHILKAPHRLVAQFAE